MGEAFICRASNNSNVNIVQEIGNSSTDIMSQKASTDNFSLINHSHDASNIVSGTLPISRGGTGATTKSTVRANLEVVKATVLYSNQSGTSGTVSLSDTASNYQYLEIYTSYSTCSKTNKTTYGTKVDITYMAGGGSSALEWYARRMAVGTTTLTVVGTTSGYMDTSRNYNIYIGSNVWIYYVIGYKY